MSEFIKLIEGTIEGRLADLHTAMPCRVERFNESAGTADVLPLFKRKFKGQTAQNMPLLVGLPAVKRKYKSGENIVTEAPFYEPGDIVLVVFCERAMDRALLGQPVDPLYNRKHSLDDGVIIGLLR